MLGLKSATDPEWPKTALSNEGALLHDHAHLERKAAGNALTLVGQLPDHAPEILEVVHEELEHFERVCGLLEKRNLPLGPDTGNPYVKQLTEVGGRRRLLDRLLKMGLVEARSFERFSMLANAASGDLAELYRDLQESEAGHHVLFVRLAYSKFPKNQVRERWEELATIEAEIVANTPWGPRIH